MLEGDLKNLSFNDVLQVLASGQKTGLLVLSKGGAAAQLGLNRGQLGSAHLTLGPHLGELLVKMDLLTTFEVQTLLARQPHPDLGLNLGQLALEAGYLEPAALKRALRAHILEALTELFSWRSGKFAFGEHPLGAAQAASEYSFDTGLLLMEAVSRVDLWHQGSAAPDSIFERVGDPTRSDLPHHSWEVLGHVNGQRSARSIAAELDLPGGEVYHLLHRLHSAGVIAPARYPGEALNALVLSPDACLQPLLRLSLERANLTVHKVGSQAAALEFVRERRPHVLVVDDAGDGWTFVRTLRGLAGRSHLPVVVLGDSAPRSGLFGFKRPRAHLLNKPFHELELQQLVTALAGRQLS